MWASASSSILVLLLSAVCCKAGPLAGNELSKRDDGVAVLNEPCYGTHHHGDGACDGYMVCCVAAGTCISKHQGQPSSNKIYYEGGCVSTAATMRSGNTNWTQTPGCKQQGECTPQFIQVCKGGTTKPGLMTALPQATADRLMTGSCEASCPKSSSRGYHSSRGGSKSNETTTTTTTTTVITRVTGTMKLAISDATAVNATKMGPLVTSTIAAMAGFGTDHSMLTVEMPGSVSETMALTYHFDVSNLHSVKHDDVASNIAAHSASQMNAMFATWVGTCSYTVTVKEDAKAATATGTAKATTTAKAHDHDHDHGTAKGTGTGTGTGTGKVTGTGTATATTTAPDDGATSEAHHANSIMMALMAAAAVLFA